MRGILGVGLTSFALFASTAVRAQPPTERASDPFVGKYTLVSGQHGGKVLSKDHLNGHVTITPEIITTYDKEHKEVYVLRYKITGDKPPFKITMTVNRASRPDAVGLQARGLIKAEGKMVTLLYDYQDKGGDELTGFEPKTETQNRFVLERTGDR